MKNSSIASHAAAMQELRAKRHFEIWDRQTGTRTKYRAYDEALTVKQALEMVPGSAYRYQIVPVIGEMP